MATPTRCIHTFCLAIWLAAAGVFAPQLHAEDASVQLGNGESAEKAKANKELADKLPPEQAAAYLKSQSAWSAVGNTVQWLAFLALPLGIVALVLVFRHRRQKLVHETMRLMIEKGLPVPPELINPPPPAKPPKSDLRRGLIWLGLGLGLLAGMRITFDGEGPWALALIPAFVGAAYLICWIVGVMRERQSGDLWQGVLWTLFGLAVVIAARSMKEANGDWDRIADWAGVGFVPIAVGVAFLLHASVSWLIQRKKTTQG